jgi:hypothetical protein
MAQKIQTLFTDDIDDGEAEGTVRFAIDGTDYEIDLSARQAEGVLPRLPRTDVVPPPPLAGDRTATGGLIPSNRVGIGERRRASPQRAVTAGAPVTNGCGKAPVVHKVNGIE